MFSVALIGPDGAGKTTIGRHLEQSLPLPAKYLYTGINLASSNALLPTSRLILKIKRAYGWMPDSDPQTPKRDVTLNPQKSAAKRAVAWLWSYLSLANLLAEECFRYTLVWYYKACGNVVLLDRWFFADYYTSDANQLRRQPLTRRIHSFMLRRVYPKPDLVIYLEAPAEVLLARKREGTLEGLKRRRQRYLQLREQVKHFVVVDASQPEHSVAKDITSLICAFYKFNYRNKRVSDKRRMDIDISRHTVQNSEPWGPGSLHWERSRPVATARGSE